MRVMLLYHLVLCKRDRVRSWLFTACFAGSDNPSVNAECSRCLKEMARLQLANAVGRVDGTQVRM